VNGGGAGLRRNQERKCSVIGKVRGGNRSKDRQKGRKQEKKKGKKTDPGSHGNITKRMAGETRNNPMSTGKKGP